MNKPILWIATKNPNKAREYELLLPDYQIKTLFDLTQEYVEPAEDGQSFADNAVLKAKALALKTQELALGDDSGICVTALNGFPGIYSKRWTAPIEESTKVCQMLLDKLAAVSDTPNRQAMMQTSLALYNPTTQSALVFEGQVEGNLANKVKLGEGFGYDLIFQPDSSLKTYSEMGQKEKNKYSARQIAAQKLQTYLESENQNHVKEN